jgi:drug/metabolite transporter (DMT)-like permease
VPPLRVFVLTLLAMLAFAGNSLLCRAALRGGAIDAASFTAIRIASGALALWLIHVLRGGTRPIGGSWFSAVALFVYAAAFSFAYLSLTAGTGALLLFGAVQATMILWGLRRGEPMHARQLLGLTLAFGGLVLLLLPGLAAPPIGGAVLMLSAGIAWGAYSLRGKGVADPIAATAGNFLRATPIALLLGLTAFAGVRDASAAGIAYAVASGAITSGVGYAIWDAALPGLRAVSAATVQLSVPVLTAIAGILLLGESLTLRFVIASVAVLGGIAIVTQSER